MTQSAFSSTAIDIVANLWTPEGIKPRRGWDSGFFSGKMKQDPNVVSGMSEDDFLRLMDEAGIEIAFLCAAKAGPFGHPPGYQIPYQVIGDACERHPDRFRGLAGIDPFEGMKGVRQFEHAVKEMGFIGAHLYPHWFELAPDHAKYYPFYAKCVELDVPIQMQVGQSMVYSDEMPRRSVGRPITLDAVACDFPELKLIGIHVGIPWTDEMIAMAWKHKNIYIGTDAHAPKHWPESFVKYLNSYGQDKVLFGTDFPVLTFERARREFENLGIRPEAKTKVLTENARRVYAL
ncbi:MAG: amidohydrolase family protein [Mesorhizobium sp.]|nr:amidohydrolase family protein [Mesorhizobium sp.]